MASNSARREKFQQVYNAIRDELIARSKAEGMPAEVVDWYHKNLDYNVPGGKLNRGMSVVDTVEILEARSLTEDEYFKAAVLGWCVELLQSYFLVTDDIMDSSITRRGQPCWYLAPNPSQTSAQSRVGMTAINDALMLESSIFYLLKSHFRPHPRYIDLIELFHDITYKTEMGQLVDLVTAPEGLVDLGRFSLDRHHVIVIYKTAYYSFYLPVALAMYMCNVPTVYTIMLQSPSDQHTETIIHPYAVALSVLLPLGEYFQIQDDFLDFSAPPAQLGKIGTDIVDNKCSWCINTALSLCTPEQRGILDRNYGRRGDLEAGATSTGPPDANNKKDSEAEDAGGECERRVKRVYEEVGLRQVYAEYESNVYAHLGALIDAIPESSVVSPRDGQNVEGSLGLKREVFRSFLEKVYRRSK